MRHILFYAAIMLVSLYLASCSLDSSSPEFSGGEGQGGSMARFTIVNNHLYTVDHQNLKSFDISHAEKPVYQNNIPLRFGIETIFPFQNKLFLGTTTGMYIFDVSNPEKPAEVSFFSHVRSCDPVVTDGKYAYITLNSANTFCGRTTNELQIVDISDMNKPKLVKQFPLESPKGLAVRNDTLWICDNGIKILDLNDKQSPEQIQHFNNLAAFDIILNKNLALVIGESGFTQYRLAGSSIEKISEIRINQ
ncbi:MAG TPA: hypothetical protein PK167_13075 [Prolixibacteraceae bacterium]|nr:hypothetical protein [Prolixibacteraceae bacterium]